MGSEAGSAMFWCVAFVLVSKTCSETISSLVTTTVGGTTEPTRVDPVHQATADLHENIKKRSVVKQKTAPVVRDPTSNVATVSVNARLFFHSVLDVDDVTQSMTSALSFLVRWQDVSLSWNPGRHGDVRSIELSLDSVWIPHLYFINAKFMEMRNILQQAGHLTVYSNGTVEVFANVLARTLCNLDHSNFPFDTQLCALIIAPDSYHISLNLTTSTLGTSEDLILMFNWELIAVRTKLVYSDARKDLISSIQVEIRRRTTFYVFCLVLPMVLTSYMNTLVFLVPLQSGEKVSYLVSIFVSTSVFASFFMAMMPRGLNSVPTAIILLLGVVVESFIVLVATLFVLRRSAGEQDSSDVFPHSPERHPPADYPDTTVDEEYADAEKEGCLGIYFTRSTCPFRMSSTTGTATRDASMERAKSQRGCGSRVTAERLDQVFFVLSFVANTVFLFVLALRVTA